MEMSKVSLSGSVMSPDAASLAMLDKKTEIQVKVPPVKKPKKQDIDLAQLDKKLNRYIKNTRLKYTINKKIDQVVVTFIDKESGAVIKQVPTEEMQKVQEHIKDAIGLIIDKEI